VFAYDLEHIFSYTVTIAEPEVVGPIPGGVRANLYATGGEVTGPKLTGKVRPVGGRLAHPAHRRGLRARR
jgi:hypothetical protein